MLVQVKRAARITNRCEPGRWLLQTQVRVSFGQHSIRLLFEVNLMVLLGVHVDVPDDTSEKCMWCFIGQQTQVLVHENDNIPWWCVCMYVFSSWRRVIELYCAVSDGAIV